ncbi:MAG: class I SAM-dependent methyltransferase [Proteobacteria bacterium]|nr:class I SAM-dependent methyltransferase [Pseudomonadota bacterium]MBU1595268.1 class I SAM-dependent methyltransferase [Pseudomonadota bacterium]
MKKRPFLDYYTEHEISPVSQDISDQGRHLRRRNALYRHVGILPALVRGRRVIEFGPGGGFNSVHTLGLAPARYVLVDGNPTGLGLTRERLTTMEAAKLQAGESATSLDFVLSDFEAFDTDERFDIVICEGFLPLQLDPKSMLRRLATFVAPGGVMVCTCVDAASYIPDLIRRAVGQALVDRSLPLTEQARALAPVFERHFACLPGMSRPLVDWILDNVMHPFFGQLMPISDAIDALDGEFTVYGSSPHLLTDWRWYKDICDECDGANEHARRAWARNIHNLIDHSVVFPERDAEENLAMLAHADAFVRHCFAFYEDRSPDLLLDMALEIRAVAESVARVGEQAAGTAQKLHDGAAALEAVAGGAASPDFGSFVSLFGRSQQHLSLVRVR